MSTAIRTNNLDEVNFSPTNHLAMSVNPLTFTREEFITFRMYKRREHNYQPNIITTSRQEFSLLERKLLIHCINQIDHELPQAGVNLTFKIPVSEINSNYKEIREACDTIQTKRIRLVDDGKEFDIIVPFPRVRYFVDEENKAFIELTMFADSTRYFYELKNQYTKYSLEAMLKIKSLFSQRIYEIVQMHIGRKQYAIEYDLQDLQVILNCNYEFYDFKRRVILPAIEDIKEHTGLEIEYEPIKEKRRVVGVKFVVKTLQKQAMERVAEERKFATQLEIQEVFIFASNRLQEYSFTRSQKDLVLSDFDLLNKFLEIDSQYRNNALKDIKNISSYMAKCLGFVKNSK